MKIIILTTETSHHTYFLKRLVEAYRIECVIIEDNIYKSAFDIFHPFEAERDRYEESIFFDGNKISLSHFAPIFRANSVNDYNSLEYIKELSPDIIIVFGTGKIKKELIQLCPHGIINLHGGNPEEYRGLDSHLWAIYHKDFGNLLTTIHHLNEKLDDGDIILKVPVPIFQGMQLYELRRYNTEKCIHLALSALDMYKRYGYFLSTPQNKRGRYYSFMPSSLKEICLKYFRNYTVKLK